jgi:hypothetical protein
VAAPGGRARGVRSTRRAPANGGGGGALTAGGPLEPFLARRRGLVDLLSLEELSPAQAARLDRAVAEARLTVPRPAPPGAARRGGRRAAAGDGWRGRGRCTCCSTFSSPRWLWRICTAPPRS